MYLRDMWACHLPAARGFVWPLSNKISWVWIKHSLYYRSQANTHLCGSLMYNRTGRYTLLSCVSKLRDSSRNPCICSHLRFVVVIVLLSFSTLCNPNVTIVLARASQSVISSINRSVISDCTDYCACVLVVGVHAPTRAIVVLPWIHVYDHVWPSWIPSWSVFASSGRRCCRRRRKPLLGDALMVQPSFLIGMRWSFRWSSSLEAAPRSLAFILISVCAPT